MLSSILTSLVLTGLVTAQTVCPIKAYDARPGYNIMCVRGDANGVYENELIEDVVVQGSTYDATLPFQCIRKVGNANWLGYDYGNGNLCYVTEGNVEGEDNNPCVTQLPECDPARYDSGRAGEYVPPTPPASAGFPGPGGLFGGLAAPFFGFGGGAPEESEFITE